MRRDTCVSGGEPELSAESVVDADGHYTEQTVVRDMRAISSDADVGNGGPMSLRNS